MTSIPPLEATPSRHALPKLKEQLQAAVSARGAAYHNKHVVIFFFEDDDTDAEKDADTLNNCFQDVFGLHPLVVKLDQSDRTPSLTVTNAIVGTICKDPPSLHPLPTLLILAYVGHGVIDPGTRLLKLVSGRGRQSIQWKYLRDLFLYDSQYTENVDSFAILDCCHAAAARIKGSRASHVLAACGPTETSRSRAAQFVSFTMRFARAARNLYRTDKPFATTESLFDEIQRQKPSNAPSARLVHLGGVKPIAIPFKERSSASIQLGLQQLSLSQTPRTTQSVLVELSVSGTPTQILQQMKDTLGSLPAEFRVTIVDAYESNSAMLILRMSWYTYARLSSAVDFHYIGPVVGPSLLEAGK